MLIARWQDMQALITQTFEGIGHLYEDVDYRHYDLIGPDEENIAWRYYEDVVYPGMSIRMTLWPPQNHGRGIEVFSPKGSDAGDSEDGFEKVGNCDRTPDGVHQNEESDEHGVTVIANSRHE